MPVGNQRRIRALAAALLLIPGRLIAQVQPVERAHLPIEDGTDIVFVRVPFGNGSSHTTVTQIASDPSGFLWFGTNEPKQLERPFGRNGVSGSFRKIMGGV